MVFLQMIVLSIFITAICCLLCFKAIKKLVRHNKGKTKGAIRLCTGVSKLLKLDPASVSKSVFVGILLLCLEVLFGCVSLIILIVSFDGCADALYITDVIRMASIAVYILFSVVVTRNDEEPFLERLERNEEFVFNYDGVLYEIVYEYQRGEIMLSLYYHDDGAGTYIASFKNPDDFLNHAELQGKPVKQIVDDILIDL